MILVRLFSALRDGARYAQARAEVDRLNNELRTYKGLLRWTDRELELARARIAELTTDLDAAVDALLRPPGTPYVSPGQWADVVEALEDLS